jgi:hypothetical protein
VFSTAFELIGADLPFFHTRSKNFEKIIVLKKFSFEIFLAKKVIF